MVTLGLAGADVRAQETTKKTGLRLGPFEVSVVAPFTAGVDSNVYNVPDATADESFTITPTVQAVLPVGRRLRVTSTGGVAPYYFHTEKGQRHTDLFGTTRADVEVGPLTLFGGLEAARYRQRFSLEIDERIRRDVSGHLYGASVRLRRRIKVTATQRVATSTFDPDASVGGQPVSVSLDRDTQTRTLELKLPATRKTTVGSWVDFVEDRFLNDASAPAVKSKRYGIIFEFSDLAIFNGRAALGVRHFSEGGPVAAYDGPFLAANVGMPFLFGSKLQLNVGRDVNYSAIPVSAGSARRRTYVVGTYLATVTFELPWKLQGRGFGGFDESRYLAVSEPDTVTPPDEHGVTFGGALLRHLGKHLSLGGVVRSVRRTSAASGRSYDDLVYGATGDVRF